MIDTTPATIYCLLRGDTADHAYQRAKEKWGYYFNYFDGESEKEYQKRIVVVRGDVSQSRLGIEESVYSDLVDTIDCVIHSAADVRHFGKYEIFEKANVVGTQNVIDFCFAGKEKTFHHVSTSNLLRDTDSNTFDRSATLNEKSLENGQRFDDYVYLRSKLKAEKLVYRARSKGLKASIYRIGNLVGRHTDGLFQENIGTNYLYNHIKALIRLNKFPSSYHDIPVEMAPIDFCSRGMVKLVLLKDALGYNFHLLNPYSLTFGTLTAYLNQLGYFIETVDGKGFSDAVHARVDDQRFQMDIELNRIYFILMHDYNKEDEDNPIDKSPTDDAENNPQSSHPSSDLSIDQTFTVEVLKKAGFFWPEVDLPFITKIIKHCNDVGYIT